MFGTSCQRELNFNSRATYYNRSMQSKRDFVLTLRHGKGLPGTLWGVPGSCIRGSAVFGSGHLDERLGYIAGACQVRTFEAGQAG